MYRVTKRYGQERGFSCAFRQWKAESHCHFLHGYALAFEFIFEAETLDARNWVVDFGSFKEVKRDLEFLFDHTVAIALDDPMFKEFDKLSEMGLAQVRPMRAVGCEAFATEAYRIAEQHLIFGGRKGVKLVSCTVSEHNSNSATYFGPDNGKENTNS